MFPNTFMSGQDVADMLEKSLITLVELTSLKLKIEHTKRCAAASYGMRVL